MTIAVDNFGSTVITAGATSRAINFSAATDGTWVYCWVSLGGAVSALTVAGFTSVVTPSVEGTAMYYGLFRRKKVAGDTTAAISWTGSAKGTIVWVSVAGVDGTTPDESATIANNGTTSRTGVPTPSATPTATNRFALAFFGARTTNSANKPISWTADAGLIEVIDIDNNAAASSPWIGAQIAISPSAVTNAAHTYTGSHNVAESHDGSVLLYLIPAAGGGGGSSNWGGSFADAM